MVKCENAMVYQNTIFENNDGIVCSNGHPLIDQNQIYNNKSNGIIIMGQSNVKIMYNVIKDNDGVGLFIRDKSRSTVLQNQVTFLKRLN